MVRVREGLRERIWIAEPPMWDGCKDKEEKIINIIISAVKRTALFFNL